MIPIRLILAGAGVAALLGAGSWWTWKVKADEASRWKAKLEAAQQQADANASAVGALDGLNTKTIVIRERADRAVQAVEQAPGAETPIPAAVRDAWLLGLRHDDPAEASDPGSR